MDRIYAVDVSSCESAVHEPYLVLSNLCLPARSISHQVQPLSTLSLSDLSLWS